MWPLIRRDIIRDCQRVAALLSEDGCRENCRNMTSTDGIEYKNKLHVFYSETEVGPITKELYRILCGIQFGDIEGPEGWIYKVK